MITGMSHSWREMGDEAVYQLQPRIAEVAYCEARVVREQARLAALAPTSDHWTTLSAWDEAPELLRGLEVAREDLSDAREELQRVVDALDRIY